MRFSGFLHEIPRISLLVAKYRWILDITWLGYPSGSHVTTKYLVWIFWFWLPQWKDDSETHVALSRKLLFSTEAWISVHLVVHLDVWNVLTKIKPKYWPKSISVGFNSLPKRSVDMVTHDHFSWVTWANGSFIQLRSKTRALKNLDWFQNVHTKM